ncbi:MAG TPA: hypothetical protein VGR15_10415 [Bacteroidota bacterium]|jgi:hypothetical protein|nr:hypothetical protein [Bacteroidota bacterium]
MRAAKLLGTFTLFVAVMITGCNKDENPVNPPGGSVTYVGTLANPSETGSLILTFASAPSKQAPRASAGAATVISVSGSVKIGDTTIVLSGTYNTDTDSLIVSGGNYTFRGTYADGTISGTYTGPHGSGSFTAEVSGEGDTVKVYCGTYQQTSPDTNGAGRFNLIVKGSIISGITDDGLRLAGIVTEGEVFIHFTLYPTINIAHGVIEEDGSIVGTYSVPVESGTVSGTWEAHICQ